MSSSSPSLAALSSRSSMAAPQATAAISMPATIVEDSLGNLKHSATLGKIENREELHRKIQLLSRQQRDEEEDEDEDEEDEDICASSDGREEAAGSGRMDDCSAAMVLMFLSSKPQLTSSGGQGLPEAAFSGFALSGKESFAKENNNANSATCGNIISTNNNNNNNITTTNSSSNNNRKAIQFANNLAKQNQQAGRQLRFIMNEPVKTRTIFSCMWPDCTKNCDALDDIERHVRSHLGPKFEAIGDEDFYYEETEVDEATYLAIFSRTNTLPMSPSHNSDGLSSGQSFASSSPATSPVCSNASSDSSPQSSSGSSSASSTASNDASLATSRRHHHNHHQHHHHNHHHLSHATANHHHHHHLSSYVANSIDWSHFLAEQQQFAAFNQRGSQPKWSYAPAAGQPAKANPVGRPPGRPRGSGNGTAKRTRSYNLKRAAAGSANNRNLFNQQLLLQEEPAMELSQEEEGSEQLQFYMELDTSQGGPAEQSHSACSPRSSLSTSSTTSSSSSSSASSGASLESANGTEDALYRRHQATQREPKRAHTQHQQTTTSQQQHKQYLAKQQLLDHTYNCSPPSDQPREATSEQKQSSHRKQNGSAAEGRSQAAKLGKEAGQEEEGEPQLQPTVQDKSKVNQEEPSKSLEAGKRPSQSQQQPAAASSITTTTGRRPKPEQGYHLGLIVNGFGHYRNQTNKTATLHNNNQQQGTPQKQNQNNKSTISANKQIDTNKLMQANNSGQTIANHNHLKQTQQHNTNKQQFFHDQSTSSQSINHNNSVNNVNLKLSRTGHPGGNLVPSTLSATSAGSGSSGSNLSGASGGHVKKPRGENKKCRKVYGMERRDLWCIQCRWKKACSRFCD